MNFEIVETKLSYLSRIHSTVYKSAILGDLKLVALIMIMIITIDPLGTAGMHKQSMLVKIMMVT